ELLLAINGLLLVLGCFLEVTATLLLVLPILAPALSTMGIDPVHFSIIFTHNMEIGLVHPPVGLNLFVLSAVAVAPMGAAIRGILPFLVILLIVLAVITYAPVLTLWLPDPLFRSRTRHPTTPPPQATASICHADSFPTPGPDPRLWSSRDARHRPDAGARG